MFEYKKMEISNTFITYLTPDVLADALNELGSADWQLVSTLTYKEGKASLIFMRQKRLQS